MKRLEALDLELAIGKKEYKKELEKLQYEMLNIQQFLFNNKIGLIIAFEGMDAAGKGGAIKRLTQNLDPRGVLVHPISAPKPHEKRYHYLHRFWRKLPQYGQIGIFDRSWYGRVLVERIEGFANNEEWERAYDEIIHFEKTLTDDQYIVLKFWIHIDKDQQLARFKERQTNPMKAWKLTDEDWRNREKFDEYVACANEMFEKTDNINAPWVLISGNNKQYARINVLKETISRVKAIAEQRGLTIPFY
ncbi:polyphosphate kinase 2 family protein [Ureibacillus chungkukjangi]|uniref:Polyphosphate kinase 2 (PPK2 family) n=1 Tax=Ureibacillus chungkukjangi TaxID=1202712 RepID=A0A318TMG7_9BACL|nr:polyphosphate kinase [Ureibacillus chungkukjangi]MCM3388529.1 polyphosphate kinase [Ureibacillus chungkukjangi]PYF05844.1 polyphosphate kinase 2 (PPK2 family) [Ureibacillus chungkukjangi]